MKKILVFLLLIAALESSAQSTLGRLTVDKIMRDPKWIGTSPSDVRWSWNSKMLFFNWNPEGKISDSLTMLGSTIYRQKKLPANNVKAYHSIEM